VTCASRAVPRRGTTRIEALAARGMVCVTAPRPTYIRVVDRRVPLYTEFEDECSSTRALERSHEARRSALSPQAHPARQ